jgi:hypothetical protein
VLPPGERSIRARIGAETVHGLYDSRELTAKAREKSPSSLNYWERKADPDGVLPEAERLRRAEHLRRAYFARLSLASAKARRRKAATT